MFYKYLKLILFSTVLLQASPKLFSLIGDKMEAFQKDCNSYQKSLLLPKKIRNQCKAYNSKVNRAFKYGYKLDPDVDKDTVDYDKADTYNNFLQNLEEDKSNILIAIYRELEKAREQKNIEYYKLLISSSQINLQPIDYNFMKNHKAQFSKHPQYIKYENEQAKLEEARRKEEAKLEEIRRQKEAERRQKAEEAERRRLIKREKEMRHEEMLRQEKEEELQLKKIREELHALAEKFKQSTTGKTCKEFIVLHSASYIANESGKSIKWVYASGKKINVWEKPSSRGKGRKVGEMRIGSHARIVSRSGDDYKIISPLDKSTGWVNKGQVERLQYQDINTNMKCTPFTATSTPSSTEPKTLHYKIVKKDTQKKGGQLNPPTPPKYTHISVDATLQNAKELTKENVKSILQKIIIEIQASDNPDGISVALYQSDNHMQGSSPFASAQWWPKGHSFSPNNVFNIENKSTHETTYRIDLPAKVDDEKVVTRLSEQKRKEIFTAHIKSEDKANAEAERKYPLDASKIPMSKLKHYDFKSAMFNYSDESERLQDKYKKELLKEYQITEEELKKISMEGIMEKWPMPKY